MSPVRRLRSRTWLFTGGLALAAALGVTTVLLDAQQPKYAPDLYSGLSWRMLGPFRGGRVDAVTGVKGRPNEFYFGAVNGGVWKTIDAGRVWTPVFDSQPVASIGAIAVAASSPDTVYVGSGESTLRDSVGYGNGMYKSTDAGKTWTHIGLDATQHIAKVAIDPANPNRVFVAAIGHLYEPHPDRGVFRTLDGGKTWTKVLFKDNNTGASDVAIDQTNPQIVYASLWNTRRPTWYTYQPTNGPGGGIYKSIDGGATWKQLTVGLPNACIGKVGIGLSPANPRRVYAVIDDFLQEGSPDNATCPGAPPGRGAGAGAGANAAGAPDVPAGPPRPQMGGFYRSDDAGMTWTKLTGDNALWGRGWYFEHIAVDPKNADIIYVPNVATSRSLDGGKTWVALRGSPGGDDYHQGWVSPDDSNTVILASDQGTVISRNAKEPDVAKVTWSSWLNQPIAQIYHVSVDYRFPYWVTGAQQDSGAVAVRSRGKFANISMRDWEPIGAGGESGMTAADPRHPGIIFGGTGTRFDLDLNVGAPPAGGGGGGRGGGGQQLPTGESARTDWTQPLVFSKADPNALYYANQYLFKTTDDGVTWKRISNDLTRPDPGVPANLDATAAIDTDRNGKRGVIYTIAPSPLRAPLLWIGTDDGLIQVSSDDGGTWQDVTPPAVNAWSRVTTIDASHFDANEAYASVDRHQLNDFTPHIYRTKDLGKTWTEITRGLPAGAYVHVVKEDPGRRGMLFAGTEQHAYISFDDGDSWQSLQLNLPVTSVRDFEVHGNDLIVATHGRGFWVIDDIAALRQINDTVAASANYLFKPDDAIQVLQGGDNGTPTQKDEATTPNPPNGAPIDYYLGKAAPAGVRVSIEILDASGNRVGALGDPLPADANAAAQPAANAGAAAGRGGRGGRGGGAGGGAGRGAGGAGVAGGGGQGGANIPNTSILWRPTPEPFQKTAGMHRVYWSPGGGGGRGGRGGGGGAAPTGPFTVKLTVGADTYTQTLTFKPDPRMK